MKKRTAFLVALLATTVGIVCLVLYQERFEREASGGSPIPILVAAQDLPIGTPITEDRLSIVDLPEAYLEPRHIPASELQRIVGLRVSSAVRANESLLWTDLANSEQRRDLSGLVQDGMRAFTIEADATSSFGGLLRPGDRVDVLLTVEAGDRHETATIAQNLLVLAAGSDTGARTAGAPSSGAPNQITLSVTLEQSQTLALARERGEVSLALRNPEDIRVIDRVPARTSEGLMQNGELAARGL